MSPRTPKAATETVECWYCRATVVPRQVVPGEWKRFNLDGSEHVCKSKDRADGDR